MSNWPDESFEPGHHPYCCLAHEPYLETLIKENADLQTVRAELAAAERAVEALEAERAQAVAEGAIFLKALIDADLYCEYCSNFREVAHGCLGGQQPKTLAAEHLAADAALRERIAELEADAAQFSPPEDYVLVRRGQAPLTIPPHSPYNPRRGVPHGRHY